jgi:ERCC4-type nuclease
MATFVLVDTNAGEDALFATLARDLGDDRVTRQRLDLGDVEVRGEIGRILFERKSWNDLVSSLRDGRYGTLSSIYLFRGGFFY